MSKRRYCLRLCRTARGRGLVLLSNVDGEHWRTHFVLLYWPREKRVWLRFRKLWALSWWPVRIWDTAALLAERALAAGE
jgi:hypothetical protein